MHTRPMWLFRGLIYGICVYEFMTYKEMYNLALEAALGSVYLTFFDVSIH